MRARAPTNTHHSASIRFILQSCLSLIYDVHIAIGTRHSPSQLFINTCNNLVLLFYSIPFRVEMQNKEQQQQHEKLLLRLYGHFIPGDVLNYASEFLPHSDSQPCHKGVGLQSGPNHLSLSVYLSLFGRFKWTMEFNTQHYLHLMFYGRAINILSLMNAYVLFRPCCRWFTL